MDINKKELNEKLQYWDNALKSYSLPAWEELPELNLYMDQIIILMNKYLSIYCENPEEDKLITPSIINNYVKLKVIPSPVKKKYSKTHLAYLIMVCTLKQCLSISTIKTIVPLTDDEEHLKSIYKMFCENSKESIKTAEAKVSEIGNNTESRSLHETVLKAALEASACKLFTEKIVEASGK